MLLCELILLLWTIYLLVRCLEYLYSHIDFDSGVGILTDEEESEEKEIRNERIRETFNIMDRENDDDIRRICGNIDTLTYRIKILMSKTPGHTYRYVSVKYYGEVLKTIHDMTNEAHFEMMRKDLIYQSVVQMCRDFLSENFPYWEVYDEMEKDDSNKRYNVIAFDGFIGEGKTENCYEFEKVGYRRRTEFEDGLRVKDKKIHCLPVLELYKERTTSLFLIYLMSLESFASDAVMDRLFSHAAFYMYNNGLKHKPHVSLVDVIINILGTKKVREITSVSLINRNCSIFPIDKYKRSTEFKIYNNNEKAFFDDKREFKKLWGDIIAEHFEYKNIDDERLDIIV